MHFCSSIFHSDQLPSPYKPGQESQAFLHSEYISKHPGERKEVWVCERSYWDNGLLKAHISQVGV
jgi:hypothetical protein